MNGGVTSKEESKAVWSIDAMNDDDVELMDEDDLLEEEDLTKPDPTSLRGNFCDIDLGCRGLEIFQ